MTALRLQRGARRRRPSGSESAWTAYASDPIAVGSAVLLGLLLVLGVCSPWISPYDPDELNLMERYMPPSGTHWLGTDEYGRDQLSRLMAGAGVTLLATGLAVVVGIVVGVPTGLLAGYYSGWIDWILSRFFDGIFALPSLIIAITVVAVVGPGLIPAMLAIGVIFSPGFFRVTRAAARKISKEAFVESAVSIGCSDARILMAHVLPNAFSPIMVQTTVALGNAVIAEASLSFLGLGVQPPQASWGSMLGTAFGDMAVAPYLVIPPGVLIMVTVLSFTQAGEGLRVALGVERLRRGLTGLRADT